MTQEFDPAALLAEWTRVHESATKGAWEADDACVTGRPPFSRPVLIADTSIPEDTRAIAHYHNTYGALLDVARGLVEWRKVAVEVARCVDVGSMRADECDKIIARCDALLAPLARLAAGGEGT